MASEEKLKEKEARKAAKAAKKKDKKEGRRIKSLTPMSRMEPFIMRYRTDATNYISATLDIGPCEAYIQKKRAEGLEGFGLMHIFLATFVRAIARYPQMNRFVRGQRVYARNCIEVMITVKREMSVESPDTVVKMIFPVESTAEDVYRITTEEINKARADVNSFDETAKALNYIPRPLLRFAVGVLYFLDYYGWLPRWLTKLSPFHGSFAITSMGSLGIPPIYHHLYNFGNLPIFLAFGVKYRKNELQSDGTVKTLHCVDYRITCDERIADGYTYATALKYMRGIYRHPEVLDNPPDKIYEDLP
ncbi:MAG: hypothetical protein J5925_01830 [Clostridia bacterium]|nr:hypothetical protein [Clostridia bacterium]MBR4798672.1 hypothetical protein [Clostridia bacterium]MBR5746835.1 hypothetical protein [Clostridia bacterium]